MIRVEDQYYILATDAHDERTRVLKDGDTFALFDRHGNIRQIGRADQGVYHEGTRFVSRLELRLAGLRPLLLSSSVVKNNALLAVDLTNPDIHRGGTLLIPHGSLHVFRSKFLLDGCCHERIRVESFASSPISFDLSVEVDADFRDIFEVRGTPRAHRGGPPEVIVKPEGLVFEYLGLDKVTRITRVTASPAPHEVRPGELRFHLQLEPGEVKALYLVTRCEAKSARSGELGRGDYDSCFTRLHHSRETQLAKVCRIWSSNPTFNEWVTRSVSDLRMLVTETEFGPYPYAGVPWYSTPFGRDAIITAMQALWLDPEIARGVLRFLAATQATRSEPERDAAPGKIVHEMRRGEMAALGEIPFGRYYGTVDATPLFVMLAAAYFDVTGDRGLVKELWPHLELAMRWISEYGDPDRDGFLEYAQAGRRGLANQGWKDSFDSVFHATGELAEAPIALCEVQAYAWAARESYARLASELGDPELAQRQRAEAERLRARFEEAFWSEELSMYALALDANKRPCAVRSSNAGHCLFAGIASPEHAARTAGELMSAPFFSGWGIRTIAEGEARYNPMSYHNGSIWPHDNALIAAGFARYGFKDAAVKVLEALFEATMYFDLYRIPELYCGFVRREGEGPTAYPVACCPQAWAAGSVFMLLQSCLGMVLDAGGRTLRFHRPALPSWIDTLRVNGLPVGDARLDLAFHRYPQGVGVEVVQRSGEVSVAVFR
jgi:glycogen debranching enzyme